MAADDLLEGDKAMPKKLKVTFRIQKNRENGQSITLAADDNLHCSMYSNLWNISKGESFSSCTRHEETGDISLRICMPQGVGEGSDARLKPKSTT